MKEVDAGGSSAEDGIALGDALVPLRGDAGNAKARNVKPPRDGVHIEAAGTAKATRNEKSGSSSIEHEGPRTVDAGKVRLRPRSLVFSLVGSPGLPAIWARLAVAGLRGD